MSIIHVERPDKFRPYISIRDIGGRTLLFQQATFVLDTLDTLGSHDDKVSTAFILDTLDTLDTFSGGEVITQ